ncbi:non-heme iron oxygenase ferredoxin subunit [Micromonospora halophytica]|uniref:3-phenylpropionate/trans-cinnamate dioxygenase ferredoxin subunit n=1 Tax=Micromonospora halophytica TaxID=47864 RepID=A0A1C5HK43_9ACTN|nr:non-heme iron oxygenase ferredoxin subunit [Micromonospora halophytica]SCG46293.1 3-phenylpropionate/trans-cinnamate dioxygenase ferredoxin subunit [Micromonospora halophytica]
MRRPKEVRVCALSDLDDKAPLAVEVGDLPVVLVRVGDEVHALRDQCSHALATLSTGAVTGKGIECWLHGACFDLRTGAPTSPPAVVPVDVYPVRIDGEDVFVDLGTTVN